MNGKEVVTALKRHGFTELRARGSHQILGNGKRKITVPVHGATDLKSGTLASIKKQSEVRLK